MKANESYIRTFAVSGAIGRNLRVVLSAGVLALAGSTDVELGNTDAIVFATDTIAPVRILNAPGTKIFIAADAITAGNTVYAAASGKVSNAGTVSVGIALTSSTADGDEIEIMPDGAVTASGSYATITGVQTLTNKTLTAPVIGAATGTSLAATGTITSSGTAGIGYATGAGGTVSQATDRTTGVTLNKISGAITTQATSLAAQTSVAFTVTNSTVGIGDVIVLSIRSGPTGTKTIATVTTVAAGSFQINLFNTDASTADTGAAIINFAVIKAVSA